MSTSTDDMFEIAGRKAVLGLLSQAMISLSLEMAVVRIKHNAYPYSTLRK